MNFADRLVQASRLKDSVVVLGIDPQLDAPGAPGIPQGYTLTRFCCEIVEACARSAIAVKPQLAFYEARGIDGMRAFCEVVKTARRLGLITIADAKRGDIGTTSAAYAEAFLGDGDFNCDAVTVNPYQGSDALMPFIAKVKSGRGMFVLVKTSNPSSGEFQDRNAPDRPIWEAVAARVNGWGGDFVGDIRAQLHRRGGRRDVSGGGAARARTDAGDDDPRAGLRHPGRDGDGRGRVGARGRDGVYRQREPKPDVRL